MDLVITSSGGAAFYPERDLDVFNLGKMFQRIKGECYVRWHHEEGKYSLFCVSVDIDDLKEVVFKHLLRDR